MNTNINLCGNNNKCVECCCEKIGNVFLNDIKYKTITNSWITIFNVCSDYEKDNVKDLRPLLLFLIVGIPNLYRETFRALFMKYFETQGVNVESLEAGGWLPNNINLQHKLWCSLLLTQPKLAPVAKHNEYIEALNFLTGDNADLPRNKVAHTFHELFNKASSMKLQDFQKHMLHLLHSLAKISHNIDLICLESKTK